MINLKLSHRRRFLHFAAGAVVLPELSRIARAQVYPNKPVRIVVPVPAGGPPDLAARLIGQWLAERLGQPFVVENRASAGGNVGTEGVVRAPADGYTLLLAFAGSAINATLFEKLDYNFIRDIAPVASINHIPLVLVSNPSFPAKTVPELIAYAKANPGKVNMATAGVGTLPQVAGELFKMLAGTHIVSVRYRGSAPAVTDLLGGQVEVAFLDTVSTIEHIKSGRLRALGVSTGKRLDVLPDVATVGESVPGFEATGWCGLCSPRATPAEIIDLLNREVNAGLVHPKIRTRLADFGAIPFVTLPGGFATFIVDETQKWGKVIKFANIKPE
jgi:tripartite-type tricarboxylate transporter receptor subunit TctC